MYKALTKYGQLAAFSVGLVVIVVFFASVFSGVDAFNGLTKEDRGTTTIFNAGLYLTIGLLIICAVVALLFGIWHMVTNPKGAMKAIIALAILLVLFFALYATSEPETSGIVANAVEKFNLTAGQSQFIGAALKSTLILGGIAVLSFIVSELTNIFK